MSAKRPSKPGTRRFTSRPAQSLGARRERASSERSTRPSVTSTAAPSTTSRTRSRSFTGDGTSREAAEAASLEVLPPEDDEPGHQEQAHPGRRVERDLAESGEGDGVAVGRVVLEVESAEVRDRVVEELDEPVRSARGDLLHVPYDVGEASRNHHPERAHGGEDDRCHRGEEHADRHHEQEAQEDRVNGAEKAEIDTPPRGEKREVEPGGHDGGVHEEREGEPQELAQVEL